MPHSEESSAQELHQTSSPPLTPIEECLPYFPTDMTAMQYSQSHTMASSPPNIEPRTERHVESETKGPSKSNLQDDYSSMFIDVAGTDLASNFGNNDTHMSDIGVYNPKAQSDTVVDDHHVSSNISKKRTSRGNKQPAVREWLLVSSMREAEITKKQLCDRNFTSCRWKSREAIQILLFLLPKGNHADESTDHLKDIFDESDMKLTIWRAKKAK